MLLSPSLVTRLLITVFISWSAVVQAEPQIMTIDHPSKLPLTGFASAFKVLGDVDADGIPDYLIGAYQQRVNSNKRQGRVFVYSGATGRLVHTIDNPAPQPDSAFGFAVAAAADLNADGVPDFLVGAFGQGEAGSALSLTLAEEEGQLKEGLDIKKVGSGEAFVFSGKDGELLYTLQAPEQDAGAGFGFSTATLGDLTGDGVPELLIGAPAQDGSGRAYIFNGQDGSLLHVLSPPSPPGRDAFGWSVAGAGDLDSDGTPDLLVGAPYTNVGEYAISGRVYAISGSDKALLYRIESPEPEAGSAFGWDISSGGDLNKDGVTDTLVGAPYRDVDANSEQGEAYAYNGVDGKLLLSLHDPGQQNAYAGFGYRVAWTADINEDGASEILISAPHQTVDDFQIQGSVFVFNGWDGRHLISFDNPNPHQGSKFGYTMASPGDLNGDGIPEFAIGASGQTIGSNVAAGRLFVFHSQ